MKALSIYTFLFLTLNFVFANEIPTSSHSPSGDDFHKIGTLEGTIDEGIIYIHSAGGPNDYGDFTEYSFCHTIISSIWRMTGL